jgi:hypothetical protein
MWTVDRAVEESGVKNVDSSYPQKSVFSAKLVQRLYPQLFFSVYNDLGDLLGFPRPYYYY